MDPVTSVHICRIVKCVVLLLLLPGLSSIYMLTRGSSSMITATTMMITMIYFCQDLDLCAISQKKLRIPIYIQCNKIVFKTQQSSVMMIMIISLTMLLKKSRTAEMVILTFLSWKITSNIWSLHGGLHLLYQPLRNDDAAFFVINITIVLRKRGPSTERDHQLPHRLQNLVKYD